MTANSHIIQEIGANSLRMVEFVEVCGVVQRGRNDARTRRWLCESDVCHLSLSVTHRSKRRCANAKDTDVKQLSIPIFRGNYRHVVQH